MNVHDPNEGTIVSRTDGTEVRAVDAARWRDQTAVLLDHGYRFRDLHAAGSLDVPQVRATFERDDRRRVMLACEPAGRTLSTIIDLVPAAAWDEREAAERAQLTFDGHATKPLMAHPDRLESWTTRVRGRDTHQVAVGPVHAGIIESGHFRFHVVGERVLHLDLRLFYKHRGLEVAAEGQTIEQAMECAARACAACHVANSIAYAQACEQALGLDAPAPIARARTVLLELERAYNHLHDIAAACAGVGFAPGNMMFASLKERLQRSIAERFGHRFMFGTVHVAGSAVELPSTAVDDLRRELRELRVDVQRSWRELLFHGAVQNRFAGVGTIELELASRLGVVGPAARAAGIPRDSRMFGDRLAYGGFEAIVPERATGDVRARVEMRALELWSTFDLLDELLDGAIEPGSCEQREEPAATGIATVESPRGRTFCAIERDGDRIVRLRLRTASYANWPAVAIAATGEILPEFPLINKSFELCYACCDR